MRAGSALSCPATIVCILQQPRHGHANITWNKAMLKVCPSAGFVFRLSLLQMLDACPDCCLEIWLYMAVFMCAGITGHASAFVVNPAAGNDHA